jgi:argininosuccinate synthase
MTITSRGGRNRRIVLAFSGSVPGAVAVRWLAERHGAEVVALTLDLGQGAGLEEVRDRALAAGAVRAHVIDAREEFARDFIIPALRACAVGDDGDPLVTALSRPIIAKHLVEVARLENAFAVAHGCAPEDEDDARRFESLVQALDPALLVLAPVREWPLSPADILARAKAAGLSGCGAAAAAIDANLWGRIARAGAAGPGAALRPTYVRTRPPAVLPDRPADVEVAFEEGVPVAVNGVALPLVELISSVETIAGSHGVGRLEATAGTSPAEPALIEAPAAIVLHEAHRALQRSVTPPDVERDARDRSASYVALVASGGWYSERRTDGDAFVAAIQKHVTGTARLKLFKGRSEVIECRSPFSLPTAQPDEPAPVGARRS